MLPGPRMQRGMRQPFMGQRPFQPYTMHPGPFAQRPASPLGAFSQMRGRGGQQRQGGGLLAKLLGKGSRGNNPGISGLLGGGASRASSSGGILQSLTNPETLNGFINNTQQALKAAQQIGPMVQQYGPLVKNLPSMWRLYKGLKGLPDADTDDVKEETPGSEGDSKKKEPKTKKAAKPSDSNKSKKKRKNGNDKSKKRPKTKQTDRHGSSPKLYI